MQDDVSFSVKDMKDLYQICTSLTSAEFKGWLKRSFQTGENSELSPAKITIGMDIVMGILHNVLHVAAQAAKVRAHDEMVSTFAVREMDVVGLGKV